MSPTKFAIYAMQHSYACGLNIFNITAKVMAHASLEQLLMYRKYGIVVAAFALMHIALKLHSSTFTIANKCSSVWL